MSWLQQSLYKAKFSLEDKHLFKTTKTDDAMATKPPLGKIAFSYILIPPTLGAMMSVKCEHLIIMWTCYCITL